MDYFSPPARDVRVRGKHDVRMRWQQFIVQSMSPPKKHRSSQRVAKDGHAVPGRRGENWTKKRMGISCDFEGERAHQMCSFVWDDNFWITSHSENYLEQMLHDMIEEAEKWDMAQKSASLWWTSTHELKRNVILQLTPSLDVTDSLSRKIQDIGMCHESATQSANKAWWKRCEDLQELRRAVENPVSKNGGTRLLSLLLWEWKLVLDPANSWKDQRMGQRQWFVFSASKETSKTPEGGVRL